MANVIRTAEEYIAELPAERGADISAVRKVILDNPPSGYEEGIEFGMISYHVPLEIFPDTYNGKPLMYAALANQKNYMSLYLMCEYMDPRREETFRGKLKASGKKVDMGKSCIRFKSANDLPLDVVAKTIAAVPPEEFVSYYKEIRGE